MGVGLGAGLLENVARGRRFRRGYRAASQILIGPVDLRGIDKSVVPAAQTADANVIEVESETRVLTSDKVLRRVVDAERLTADPEFNSSIGSTSGTLVAVLKAAIGLKS